MNEYKCNRHPDKDGHMLIEVRGLATKYWLCKDCYEKFTRWASGLEVIE